jgi:hypothetical protein
VERENRCDEISCAEQQDFFLHGMDWGRGEWAGIFRGKGQEPAQYISQTDHIDLFAQ